MKPSTYCLAILCTLSFRVFKAVVFNNAARRFINLNDDFLNALTLSEGCNSDHTPLKNSNNVSDNGLNKGS